ncbi:Double-stranded RNA-containing particles stability [Exophiala xenobiotica]|uniref:Double-stranded RNA-containing particles stability n=1 Tax=Lithohypha guttulata TaxID=1690604 RepID=A0ABR0KP63_9EURO|nr:Double-stranded RNA-containing particles stability [Lithohypha guttulata]KAK5330753.1 Double-stranded RNA-containing particles stability [Exophiala xenobiotica]
MAVMAPISFVTFGMFIVDEIEWQTANPPPSKHNLIGGAGTYAILGARLASSPCQLLSQSISWIVDVGSDFPPEVKRAIDSWNTNCIFRTDTSRLTTRAWNGYGENELRAFKYLTPKVRLEVSSLNESQLMSKSFHMVCSPERCLDITTKLQDARRARKQDQNPVVVWEPIPDLCSPEELARLQSAAMHCSVVSPNHDELKMFFSPKVVQTASQADLVAKLLAWDVSPANNSHPSSLPIAIVREGANGSTAYFHSASDRGPPPSLHLPAYHNPDMASSVIDPTGGGNTYLGALAIALTDALHGQASYDKICKHLDLLVPKKGPSEPDNPITWPLQDKHLGQNIMIAMIYALVAASLAIEQNGTPVLQQEKASATTIEYWNGKQFIDRLERYLNRERETIKDQLRRRQFKPL